MRDLNFGFFMSILIGLTGGIGAGKSVVANIFATIGIPIFNADIEAKKLMNEDIDMRAKLVAHFGSSLYQQGSIDKNYLSKIVFDDPFQLSVLNSIVHPFTIAAAKKWASAQQSPYAIKEAALIFEAGATEGLAKIIGVTAPLSLRIERVMQRDQCSQAEVEKKIKHQLSDTIKMKLCDFIILNDEQHMVIPQVLKIHEEIIGGIKN